MTRMWTQDLEADLLKLNVVTVLWTQDLEADLLNVVTVM